jgi:hypothetical protein
VDLAPDDDQEEQAMTLRQHKRRLMARFRGNRWFSLLRVLRAQMRCNPVTYGG